MKARFVSPLDLMLYFRSMITSDSMSNADLARLVAEATEKFVPAGTLLLEGDQRVEKVYLLVEGRCEVDAGAYKEIVEPPNGINWLRMHGGFETNHTTRALTDSLVLEIGASSMIERLERHPSMVEHMLRMYGRRILELRDGLPMRPEDAPPADRGASPKSKLALVERMREFAGPGGYWEHANLDAVVTIVREMTEAPFAKGDVIWERGARSGNTLSLVCGTIECTNEAGASVEVGAGFGLGFFDALANVPHSFRAVATCDGIGLRSDLNEMLAVVQHHSDMAMALLKGVSRTFSSEWDAYQISGRAIHAPLPAVGASRSPTASVPESFERPRAP